MHGANMKTEYEICKKKVLTSFFDFWLFLRGADKSLTRPRRKEATFSAFYGTWSFITTFTKVQHVSLPKPKQSILLPITLWLGAAGFLPGRANDLSAPL